MQHRTVRVKINIPKDLGLQTLATASKIFDHHVDVALEHRTFNKYKLHHLCYRQVRELYPAFQSSLVQSVRDMASASVKRDKFRARPKKKQYSGIRYDSRTLAIRGNQVSISLLGTRYKTEIAVPAQFAALWETGALAGATLCWDGTTFWLNVTFKYPDAGTTTQTPVIGIDRGMLNAAVTSDGTFYTNRGVRAKQRTMLYNKRRLQSKGTRSSRKRLKAMRGKEQRFQRHQNHVWTKQIVQKEAGTFVIEDLKGIRNKRKGKQFNKRQAGWAFFQFELFLTYKAAALGKQVVKIDPRFTSQDCNVCGSRGTRVGSRFFCDACGLSEHSDLNAARTIRAKYLVSVDTQFSSASVAEAGRCKPPINADKHRADSALCPVSS